MNSEKGWRRILVVEDESDYREQIEEAFQSDRRDWKVFFVSTIDETLKKLSQHNFDLLILDYDLPDGSGLQFLKNLKSHLKIDLPVIFMTSETLEDIREKAIKTGALDSVVKTPASLGAMPRIVHRNVGKFSLQQEVRNLRSRLERREFLEHIMGKSEEIRAVYQAVERVAWTDFSVLIYGETGTGKEIIAQAIHEYSSRRDKPFVAVDCGAIPETLMESEMFGYRKGAFTGAEETREGHFQRANGGTLFLDEISNLPKGLQKKLLRSLEERKIRKVGSSIEESIDVRFISSTNTPLEDLIERDKFRKDLYYRLNEYTIRIPPLRERKEDIPFLAQHFLEQVQKELGEEGKKLSKKALDLLYDYHWPGNVRELKHVIRRASLTDSKVITESHISLPATEKPGLCEVKEIQLNLQKNMDLKEMLSEFEKNIIKQAINEFGGNKSKTARFLNIDYKTLLKKIKIYGIVL